MGTTNSHPRNNINHEQPCQIALYNHSKMSLMKARTVVNTQYKMDRFIFTIHNDIFVFIVAESDYCQPLSLTHSLLLLRLDFYGPGV